MLSNEMNRTIYAALCACLGLSQTSAEAASLLSPAYADPENAPRPPRSRDVIYYSLTQEDAPADRAPSVLLRASALSETPVAILSRLAYRLLVVCYGPSAETYAHRIRVYLYQDGYGKPRAILRAAGIYPIPAPPQPAILWEPEGSLWRRRADLTISLRVSDELPATISPIKTAPKVTIHR